MRKKDWREAITNLEMKKILFNEVVKDLPSLTEYLGKNIHNVN
jgi:hypothetical protein